MKWLMAVGALMILGCNLHQNRFEINDVTEPERISVTNEHPIMGQGFRFTAEVTGWIDGEAELVLLDTDEAPMRSKNLSGEVHFSWNEGWTARTAHLEYHPTDVKSGSLTIVCEFKESRP